MFVSDRPDLTVVLVTWNAMPWLTSCLESLTEETERSDLRIAVIAVDNASTDSSLEVLAQTGTVRILRNRVNVGFAGAAMQGTAVADAPWLFLLNTDATLEPGFLDHIADAIRDAPPEVGSIIPDTRFMSAVSTVNHRGLAIDRLGLPHERDAGRDSSEPVGTDLPLIAGSGGAVVIRASALEHIGGFEPAYFAYLEDLDVGLRLRRAGFDAQFVADAVVLHAGSASSGVDSPVKSYLVGRNRRMLWRRHGSGAPSIRARRFVAEVGHALVHALLTRRIWGIRGRSAALRHAPYMRYRRLGDARLGLSAIESLDLPAPPRLRAVLRRKLETTRAMRAASSRH